MRSNGLEYVVRDRSLLLPFYKRFVVEPLVPAIPRWVRPNSITHFGHVLNLAALVLLAVMAPRMDRGWPFVVAPLWVHVWLFCDHADGAHARRTGKTSATGELLDHGLDLLNACYVIWMTLLTFGAPAPFSVWAAVGVAAGAAVIYWEQAEIGVFELGLLTQIESVFSLTAVLIARAALGRAAMDRIAVGGVTVGAAILGVVGSVAVVGMARAALRVRAKGGRTGPLWVAAFFGACVAAATVTGALDTIGAVSVGSTGYVLFGMRALERRMKRERPRPDRALGVAGILCAAASLVNAAGGWTDPTGIALPLIVAAPLAGLAIRSAHEAWRAVARIDRGDPPSTALGTEGPTPSARSHR